MEQVRNAKELLEQIQKLDKDNSVCQIFIPGKGKLTIVLQEKDLQTIAKDVQQDKVLKQQIQESRQAYKKGNSLSTSELIQSLSPCSSIDEGITSDMARTDYEQLEDDIVVLAIKFPGET